MATMYGALVKEAIKVFDKFTPGKHQVENFLKDASKDLKKRGTQQQKFVLDVISGCIEHKTLVDLVIDDFYGQNRKIPKSHRSQLAIICYLATFALDEIGLRRFDIIVKALDCKNMHAFLSFFSSNLTTCIQEKWNSVSDAAHVEEKLIGPLLRWQPEINKIIVQLAKQFPKGHQVEKVPKTPTEPQEVPLTHPKPVPNLIPLRQNPRPRGSNTFKPTKADTLRKEVIENRQAEEEFQRIQCLLEGAGDHNRGHITTKEPARDQKAPQLQEKELMQKYAKKRLQEEKSMRDLVRQVAERQKNYRVAEEKLTKSKQSIVKEVTKKNQELLRKALEEAQAELILKFKTISEILTVSSLPQKTLNALDGTEPAGQVLMEEMSLSELQKRLFHLKEQQKKVEIEKNERLRQKLKKEKQQEQERLKNMTRKREEAKAAPVRQVKEKAREEKMKQDQKKKCVEKSLILKKRFEAPKQFEMRELKQQDHQENEERLHEANVKRVRFADPLVSEHQEKVESQSKEESDETLMFEETDVEPPPSYKRGSNTFKPTKADTLRKEAIEIRQAAEEVQRIQCLLEGAGDHNRGHITTKEPVRDQKAPQLQEKELMQKYAKKRLQEEREMRDLVRQVAERQKNYRVAEEKLTKSKQSIVKEVTKKNQALLRKALEEAQAELILKFKTISEILTVSSLPHMRLKALAGTEPAGQYLMEQMSLSELQKRLFRLKELEESERHRQMAFDASRREVVKAAAIRKAENTRKEEMKQNLKKKKAVVKSLQSRGRKEMERRDLKPAPRPRVELVCREKCHGLTLRADPLGLTPWSNPDFQSPEGWLGISTTQPGIRGRSTGGKISTDSPHDGPVPAIEMFRYHLFLPNTNT